jgi:hypothetical protein
MEAPVNRCADTLNPLEVIAGSTGRRRFAGITRNHGFAPLALVTPCHWLPERGGHTPSA